VVHHPTAIRQPGRFQDARISESSAVIRGKENAGVLWTLNDSGNPPQLFAVDTTGATRAVFRVAGVVNIDWEALSAGPCGGRWCLWIGDIGDNRGIRRTIVIHRVVEPALRADPRERWISPLDSLVARYPDGPHDAESLVVTATGNATIITKGRDGWIGVYRVPPAFGASRPVVLELVGRLPIATGFLLGHLVTDAALSPNGQVLAVRTYRSIYLFDQPVATGGLPGRPRVTCPIGGLDPQGEGVAWWDDQTLVLTSERGLSRVAPPITLLRCPLE
jgi:hypothetical protein